MDKKKSILSSAELIAEILGEDEEVKKIVRMVYPIMAPDKAQCPYIVYRMANLRTRPMKGEGHADTAEIDVMCCGANVKQMVETSEAARLALDGIQAVSGDGLLRMRSCLLTGVTEGWESQTFIRTLTFTVRIN